MTLPIYDENTLSDLHKDARGFRPRAHFFTVWDAMTVEERNAEWLSLCDEVDQAIDDERRAQERAVADFEARLEALIETGAKDREQAKRWLIDSLDLGECHDAGYVCYNLGLPYSMDHEFKGIVGDGG